MTDKKNIVILGAGFGGIRAARRISKKLKRLKLTDKYRLVLIDRNKYHTYTPLLYEAATTSKETANYCKLKEVVAFPIEEIIKKMPVDFINNSVVEIDVKSQKISLADKKTMSFDYLIISLGSETNYFDIAGLEANALPIKTFKDALEIRNRILDAMHNKKDSVRVVIGGGGSTGVELAGEIKEWLCELQEEIRQCTAEVIIVEAASTILNGFEKSIINKAESRLKKLGVEIKTDNPIVKADKDAIFLKSGEQVPYDVLIWTGGVKASHITYTLPLKREEGKKQILATEQMECLPETPDLKIYGKIYGIGDAVCYFDPVTKKPIPKVARAAIIQADIASHNIIEDIKLKEKIEKQVKYQIYKPKQYPYVIPVGGKYAIAKIGPFIISGFLGWVFKGLVELNYLLSILGPWKAIKTWLAGLVIFVQNDRLG